MRQKVMSVVGYLSNVGYLLPFYPAIPFLQTNIREAVPVAPTLDLLGF